MPMFIQSESWQRVLDDLNLNQLARTASSQKLRALALAMLVELATLRRLGADDVDVDLACDVLRDVAAGLERGWPPATPFKAVLTVKDEE